MQTPLRTYDWPVVAHRCLNGAILCARFKASCCDGATTTCPYCNTVFRYEKPKARRNDAQPQGQRTHF